jgi:hypothetical protein
VKYIEVDQDRFAKLYVNQLAFLWELSKPSIKVLSYILSTIKPNDDKVYFDVEACNVFCEWSVRSVMVYRGLLGLVNARIIARTNRNHFYYINPTIVFNGDRMTVMTQYTKKKRAEQLQLKDTNQQTMFDSDGFLDQKE